MIKIGLDLHGVIDKDPEFFSDLSKYMIKKDNEVYIITGHEEGKDLDNELKKYKMWDWHTSILSITSYQKNNGTSIEYLNGDKTQPMMNQVIWDTTKAVLCYRNKIDIMIDDSPIYGQYFKDNIKTQYILYNSSMREFLKTIFYGDK